MAQMKVPNTVRAHRIHRRLLFKRTTQPDVYRVWQGDKAAETYVACRPGANANTSSCSGQINCFYLRCFYLGSPRCRLGLAIPGGINETDAHMCIAHTHTRFRRSRFHPCVRAHLCLPLCRRLRAGACVRAAGLQRMNQQVLTHASESGLPAGLPAWRMEECKGVVGGRGLGKKNKKNQQNSIND